MSFWLDDLAVLFRDFGTTVQAGAGTFSAIYDAEFVGVGAESPVESIGPALTCRSSDVAALAHGATLTVGGASFVVRGIEPDGTGITVLRLERAA